jgi:hypothetical protein
LIDSNLKEQTFLDHIIKGILTKKAWKVTGITTTVLLIAL